MWQKIQALFSINLQGNLIYKANAFLWMLTDAVPAIFMPLVWLASYQGRSNIAGFTPSLMVTYYLAVFIINNIVGSGIFDEVARDIREGQLAKHLIRPISYLSVCYFSNISWRIVRLFMSLPVIIVGIIVWHNYLSLDNLNLSLWFWLALLLAHFLNFLISYMIGSLALILVETSSFFSIYFFFNFLLSGQIAPLAMFPSGLITLATYTPFRYILSFPLEILTGQLSTSGMVSGLIIGLIWFGIVALACKLVWNKGLKSDFAVGI